MISNNSALTAGYDDPDTESEVDDTPQPSPEALSAPEKVTLTQPQDALNKSAQIPPKLVADVQDNPELLRPVARSMAAINLHNLFTRIQHPATSAKDRLDFQSMLNKMSGLDAKEAATGGGAGFSIVINIPGSDKGVTVDGTAKRIPDEAGL